MTRGLPIGRIPMVPMDPPAIHRSLIRIRRNPSATPKVTSAQYACSRRRVGCAISQAPKIAAAIAVKGSSQMGSPLRRNTADVYAPMAKNQIWP